MSFFQNPFLEEFIGNWVLADRHQSIMFKCPPNYGRGVDSVAAWRQEPYNLLGNDSDGNPRANLTIAYTVDFTNWANLVVNVSGTIPAATTANEIITALNNNQIFSGLFDANYQQKFPNETTRIYIRQKLAVDRFKFYIVSGGAEETISFNYKSGVSELPTYFIRHTVGVDAANVAYARTFEDGLNTLVYLNEAGWAVEGDTVAGDVILHAVDLKGNILGLNPTTMQEDYQLLRGRSGLFQFTNLVNANERIVYHAGAGIGDLATRIIVNAGNTFELPHTLAVADLITPP